MKTHHFAEYVSPGHPDRLADAIAEGIVTAATATCPEALVGVEVAVHTNHVFVDGRVAAKVPRQKFLRQCRELVRDVFETAGYNDTWRPHPRELKFRHDLCIEQLQPAEAAIRSQADDQNIVLTHATADPRTNHLPPVHFAAQRLGQHLAQWRAKNLATHLGPDFKLLPHLTRDGDRWEWQRLTLSIQHTPEIFPEDLHRLLFAELKRACKKLETESGLENFGASFTPEVLFINGAGDFHTGGPEGDNGLSGKKLVVDHFGPEFPIGGGAICGKDAHKIDRAGPLRARQLAKQLARAHHANARVRLAWSPGETTPHHIEAATHTNGDWQPIPARHLPPRDWFSIRQIVRALRLTEIDWRTILCHGYFTDENSPWEK